MNLLEKLESAINNFLFLIGDHCTRIFLKIIPADVLNFFHRFIENLKAFFVRLMTKANRLIFKDKLNSNENLSSISQTALMAPILLGQFLKGLSVTQTIVLLGFTSASILSGISMIFSAYSILGKHSIESRNPASVKAEVEYERPNYYKKPSRFFELNSLRLPIYFANLNELRTVDIDITATLSNRLARMKIEKLEFSLRDHLILNVEPMLASFPLEEEGKAILRKKMKMEINQFMKDHKIEGEVSEIKLIYLLAN